MLTEINKRYEGYWSNRYKYATMYVEKIFQGKTEPFEKNKFKVIYFYYTNRSYVFGNLRSMPLFHADFLRFVFNK